MIKNNLTNTFKALTLYLLFVGCSALKTSKNKITTIKASIDLVNVIDDKVKISISPPKINSNEITFYIPQIVPGTYEYSNFGRFTKNLKAYNKKGDLLSVQKIDKNTWKISNAKKLTKLTYLVNDTFDGPNGKEIYPMGGTSFEKNNVFLMNLHTMIGYFDGMKENPYRLSIRSPKNLTAFTSLPIISKSDTLDFFDAKRYFHVIDNPILYSKPNSVSFDLDEIKVGLAIYSPSNTHRAEDYQSAIKKMMVAQKEFLGDANKTPSYDILLHLMGMEELQYFGGVMGALEHHTSTTVVFVDQMEPKELTKSLIDVVSHEFFHTLTPLNIHSEEIHNFEYNTPVMSKHLWMYEGTTEYFANLFQINQGLIDAPDFYSRLKEKVDYSERYNDKMSFTEMSAGIVDEPYQANYGNVYQKGALINMCLDILLREQSLGKKGILWVMKNLAKKYGTEKPFKDDTLIDEIVAITYPEIDNFFKKHVEGTTPIDYNKYFTKVGLTMGEIEAPLRGIIFQNNTDLFFKPQTYSEGIDKLFVTGLNSSLTSIGIKEGDMLVGLDGKVFPEIKKENNEAINAILTNSLMWDADKEITITIKRDEKEMTLKGKVGVPSAFVIGIVENSSASADEISLRKAWMFN